MLFANAADHVYAADHAQRSEWVMLSTPDLSHYAKHPIAFMLRFVRLRIRAHAVIVACVLGAVACSVGTQYGIKLLVDALTHLDTEASFVWPAFGLLVGLIAADNGLWRIAGLFVHPTFVAVTGDLRRELFRHLTGHAPGYFAARMPGTLASRITATSNAVFTIENMFVWNIMPPCAATVIALSMVGTVSVAMVLVLMPITAVMVVGLFRLAAMGEPLHHDFANKAAAVDGEMVDVISNMPLVWSFGGFGSEYRRFDATVAREMTARRSSLFFLERIRALHAVLTIILTIGLVGWALSLWERGAVSAGDVVLSCTLGTAVLHATRDLAVALVDVTQHFARLREALGTLLVPHELRDDPDASRLVSRGASVRFERVSFIYPNGKTVFEDLDLTFAPGERVGLVGPSGGGKSTLIALMQRFYEPESGRILIDGQDIARVTRDSLRAAIAVVPQDLSLFNRSVMENIRYGRPDATDAEVLEAAAYARCRDFIEALPLGFSTVVGDRGVQLSGGQRQRIAIARAFLKDAPLLLLDEATSALDSESEEAIQEALAHLMAGRTVIAIAHRLSTVHHFDRIIVLKAGEVVEDGPPDRLMQEQGIYRSLVTKEVSKLAEQLPA